MGAPSKVRRLPVIARGASSNLALLGLLAAAFITGWLAFAFATAAARWSLVVHAAAGFAILALLPWKSMIVRRGLERPRPGRWASVLLGVLVLVSLGAGLLHSTGLLVDWGSLTAMDFHVGAALTAVPLAVLHVPVRQARGPPPTLSPRRMFRGGPAPPTTVAAFSQRTQRRLSSRHASVARLSMRVTDSRRDWWCRTHAASGGSSG